MKARNKKTSAATVPTAGDESSGPEQSVSAAVAMQESPKATASRYAYRDLREWIAEAEKLGEVRVVRGASWQREIGIAADIVMHSETAPCVIFDEIPGCQKGFRVLTNFFGDLRKNMTLGYPTSMTKLELSEAFLQSSLKEMKTIPYKEVEDGPIFENIMMGDDVDVTKFPTPIWHEGDGGRYIGTGSFNVTRDPEEDWVNLGTYRVMIHDQKSVGFYISPGKHGRIHRDKYQARNEPMPTVIVLGGDPLTFLMACSETPYGICEYDIVGGMRGEAERKGRSANGPAITAATFARNRCSISRPSTTATTRSSSAARPSARPTSSRAIAPSLGRRSFATTSSARVCRMSKRFGPTRLDPPACWSASRSSSAMQDIPSRRATWPRNVMPALTAAST